MNLEQYLQQTRHAIEQLFKNLDFYELLYRDLLDAHKKTKSFIFGDYISDSNHPEYENEIKRWSSENEVGRREFSIALTRLEGASVSSNAIAGAILQITFMGIKIFSQNSSVPQGFEELYNKPKLKSKNSIKQFGVGKIVMGRIPMGLTIYAVRNQYNHLDSHGKGYHDLTQYILDLMNSYRRDDLAFDNIPEPFSEQHEMARKLLAILGWKNYEDYKKDMLEALN